MLIFPAIDLKDGKVVRLHKGSFDTVHQVADDPVATARTFYEAGARHLHMVDLDGAKDGVRKNSGIVRAVADVGLNIELGGGIRSMEDIRAVFDLGVWRVVIGSAAVTDPDFVRAAIAAYGPERVAVGIDAKNGTVRTAGWVEDSQLDYLDFARSMESFGVRHIIFTDIGCVYCLKLLLRILFAQENFNWHKGAVLRNHLADTVFICKFQTVLRKI